jgi:hypothetical protein
MCTITYVKGCPLLLTILQTYLLHKNSDVYFKNQQMNPNTHLFADDKV